VDGAGVGVEAGIGTRFGAGVGWITSSTKGGTAVGTAYVGGVDGNDRGGTIILAFATGLSASPAVVMVENHGAP